MISCSIYWLRLLKLSEQECLLKDRSLRLRNSFCVRLAQHEGFVSGISYHKIYFLKCFSLGFSGLFQFIVRLKAFLENLSCYLPVPIPYET